MGSINGCRVRCSSSSSMAGWSMVADDENDEDVVVTVVDRCKTPKNLESNRSPESVKTSDSKIKELVSLFRRLLESFLDEFCSVDSFRPLPPMTGDGKPVDLFDLFMNVAYKGGFDAVSENGSSWDEVAQETGLGFNNSASAKLIYVKYLDALARWLNRVIAGDSDGTSVELSGISDDLVNKVKDFLSEVKRKYELRKGKSAKEVGAELQWFISKSKRRFDKESDSSSNDDDVVEEIENTNLEKVNDNNNECCSSPRKRKRECSLETTLNWLNDVAKDPCDPSLGSIPEKSKWEGYGSEEPWKQLLLFRASRINTDSSCEKTWQKLQKLHPSLYDDSAGPTYNLRERLSFSVTRFNEKKPGKGKKTSSGSDSNSSDEEDRPCALIGSDFQAEVPEWNDQTTESDTKWLGTQVWPLSKEQNRNNLLIERDPIGRGRKEPCGCLNPGSMECVKFHIVTKQEKLRLELGPAYYIWCFDVMGEGTLQYWSSLEQKKFKALMTSPPTLSVWFFDEMKKILGTKNRGKIVSYFYNVTLLQFRAVQSRINPNEIDSDTDELYYVATTANEEVAAADARGKPVLLTPKKRRRR